MANVTICTAGTANKIFEYLDGYTLGSLSNVVQPGSPLDIAINASIERCRVIVEQIKNEIYFQKFRHCTPFKWPAKKVIFLKISSPVPCAPTARNGESPTYEEVINQMGQCAGNEYRG